MLHDITVILVRPRFPENIGMVVRAMANMGARDLVLVRPERWDKQKALPLATSQGQSVLDAVRVEDSLAVAVELCAAVFGATARTGGWRKAMLPPEKAALEARALVRAGNRAALVFGSEDRGLTNAEVEQCTHLVNIPTALEHPSLNLAQAVLILLYECVKADMALPFVPTSADKRGWTMPARGDDSRRATQAEEALLLQTLQETLIAIDHLPKDNPAWFMQPMRRFMRKSRLRRHEFDMLMGICRQMRHKLGGKEWP